MLHLIFQPSIEAAILKRIDAGDVAVFLDNAVLRTLQNSDISSLLTQQLAGNRLCVLLDDISVRGIIPNELVKGIEVIDYAGLVELTASHPVIQSWS
ncbi:MAG: sulfurtransferase complex subunit TusB [Methylococcales bacterium]|nr:sulfurtransferase complex subunit TusB [Methylococcales bacterium]